MNTITIDIMSGPAGLQYAVIVDGKVITHEPLKLTAIQRAINSLMMGEMYIDAMICKPAYTLMRLRRFVELDTIES